MTCVPAAPETRLKPFEGGLVVETNDESAEYSIYKDDRIARGRMGRTSTAHGGGLVRTGRVRPGRRLVGRGRR